MADNLTHKTDADYWAAENLKTILSSRSICLSCRFAFRRLGIERWNQKCSWDGHPAKKVSIKWRCKVLNALCLPSRLPLRILDVYPKCALDHDTPVDMSLGLLISCIQVSKAYASPLPSSTTCASSQMMSRTSTTVNAIMPLEAPGIHAMVGREIPGKLTMSSIRTVTAGLRMMNAAQTSGFTGNCRPSLTPRASGRLAGKLPGDVHQTSEQLQVIIRLQLFLLCTMDDECLRQYFSLFLTPTTGR